jgi:hypothetical protein
MPPAARSRTRHLAAVAVVALLGTGALAGCGEDQTGQPGPVEADFTPRLVVTADAGALVASVGPKGEGDPQVSASPARLPAGSVLEVRVAGAEPQRVVGVLTAPGEAPADLSDRDVATPAPLVDTGVQRPGDEVVIVLADPGTLRLSEWEERDGTLDVEITPRPDV